MGKYFRKYHDLDCGIYGKVFGRTAIEGEDLKFLKADAAGDDLKTGSLGTQTSAGDVSAKLILFICFFLLNKYIYA
jgi:hypothetical protein